MNFKLSYEEAQHYLDRILEIEKELSSTIGRDLEVFSAISSNITGYNGTQSIGSILNNYSNQLDSKRSTICSALSMLHDALDGKMREYAEITRSSTDYAGTLRSQLDQLAK